MRVKDILKDNSLWIPGSLYKENGAEISIMLPTFRRFESGHFNKAVDSVINQTYQNWELIIVDDCSYDGTFDEIKRCMEQDGRISCIRHTSNIGLPAISCYEAYMKCQGEYIAFIFDDNEWDRSALKKIHLYMKKNAIKAAYGVCHLMYGKDNRYIELGSSARSILDIHLDNFIANGAVILNREVIETVGLYDPHLSMARVCDWDLWKRIANVFDFVATDIFVTTEHGPKLKDSLGNSFKLDGWAVSEHSKDYRNKKLLPNNYGEYNIIGINEKNSLFFVNAMKQYVNQYRGKDWIKNNEEWVLSNLDEKKISTSHKKIAVLVDRINASHVSFYRMATEDITVRFYPTNFRHFSDIFIADAVVIPSRLDIALRFLDVFNYLKMPVYYYLDDNFIELEKIGTDRIEISHFAKLTKKENFKNFRGILLSSDQMVNYFRKNDFHDNLVLLEPIIDINNIHLKVEHEKVKRLVIGFMGGMFRLNALANCVLPAIEKLSAEMPITFVCPNDGNADIDQFENDNLEIVRINRSESLELTLRRYRDRDIDILVQCGEDNRNNLYKTKNALVNAVQMSAVLVVSNIEPYNLNIDRRETYIISENKISEWYENLKKLAFDGTYRQLITENAYDYCIKRYGSDEVAREFKSELVGIEGDTYYKLNKSSENFCRYLIEREHNHVDTCTENLFFSTDVEKKRKFKSVCNKNEINGVGIIFAYDCESCWTIDFKISSKGRILREASVQSRDINKNQWTYFVFEPIYNTSGKDFIIELDVRRDGTKGLIGYFENKSNRSFLYKLTSKFGFPTKGKDIILIDYRN